MDDADVLTRGTRAALIPTDRTGGQTEKPDDRSTQGWGAAHVAAGDDVGDQAAVAVGRLGEGDEGVLAGDRIEFLGGVAKREDRRIAGALLLIHLEPGVGGQVAGRLHADGRDDHVGGHRAAIGQGEVVGGDVGGVATGDHRDAVVNEMLFDDHRHLLIQRRHNLRRPLNHRDLQPTVAQVLRHLQADETTTDDGRGLHLIGQGRDDGVHILHGVQVEGALNAGDGRHDRGRAGGEHQVVIGDDITVSGGHGLVLPVDGGGAGVHAHIQVEPLGERFRGL